MELSPSNPEADPRARPSRRKSGRVSKQTDFLSPATANKRKRDASEPDVQEDEDEDASQDDLDDDEPDLEELRDQRRKQKRKVGASNNKPVAKRQKPNGAVSSATTTLVRRPANKTSKVKKGAIASAEEVGGLYGVCD